MELQEFFARYRRVALAFSGGTDSAFLLRTACDCGVQVQPYFIKTAFQPAFELEDARRLAGELGVALCVIEADILGCPQVAENGAERCYHCKRVLFTLLRARAAADGYDTLIDGTNASDVEDDRPGMRALRELGVLSPLRICGVTKAHLRERSRALGLFTADKPAYACLATRIPAGERITAAQLEKVEAAESALFAMGFTDLRVRVFHGAARVQLPAAQLAEAVAKREEICSALSPHFGTVLLDLRAR